MRKRISSASWKIFSLVIGVSLICGLGCSSNDSAAPTPDAAVTADANNNTQNSDGAALPTAVCGNGVLEPGETCDKTIVSPNAGACPTDCDDMISCTKDSVVSAECTATCSNTEITTCNNTAADGCCPTGCNSTTDLDCSASCGNGVIDNGETCDKTIVAPNFGACPTNCDDQNSCTTDAIVGGECTKACSNTVITTCSGKTSDGCCPAGCVTGTDVDCISTTCGNGVLDQGETCDTKITAGNKGACPTSCDDKNACTKDSIMGSNCTVSCNNTTITTCSGTKIDSCCPTGCVVNTDIDCVSTCGNGVVDTGETCDTKIATGTKGACPTSCEDKNACTNDKMVGSGCTVSCSHTEIIKCSLTSDGCCPSICTGKNDADCASTTCGNGVVDTGETCDTKIAAGSKGSCPTSCDDKNACTTDKFVGSGCTLSCSNTAITTCSTIIKDGCCPVGCTQKSDGDC